MDVVRLYREMFEGDVETLAEESVLDGPAEDGHDEGDDLEAVFCQEGSLLLSPDLA